MKPYENSLERILESAIVVSWADLMRGAQTGLIHSICASPGPWQAGVAPDSNAHRRREHGRRGVGERSLRSFRLSAHPPCTGLNSGRSRSEEHTSELQSQSNLVCR